MEFLHIIAPVFIGALIGYCTNYIAIKMMFHPYKAIYIGKWKLPFTPGIIPKNQSRLANATGNAASEYVLTREVLEENFRRNDAGKQMIRDLVSSVCESGHAIRELFPDEKTEEELIETVSTILSRTIIEKAEELDFQSILSEIGKEAFEPLLNRPILSMFMNEAMMESIYQKLGETARDYVTQYGEEPVRQFISEYLREMGAKPVREILGTSEEKEKLESLCTDLILHLAERYADALIDRVNIKEIIRQRIEDMNVSEVEELVLSVMKQELQAVINLGALIGAVIGVVNIFL